MAPVKTKAQEGEPFFKNSMVCRVGFDPMTISLADLNGDVLGGVHDDAAVSGHRTDCESLMLAIA